MLSWEILRGSMYSCKVYYNTVKFRWNNGWRDLDSVFESVRAFVYVKERREERKKTKRREKGEREREMDVRKIHSSVLELAPACFSPLTRPKINACK